MDERQRRRLEERLGDLDDDTRRALYQRAATLRKTDRDTGRARRERGSGRGSAPPEGGSFERLGRRPGASLDEYALALLEEGFALVRGDAESVEPGLVLATAARRCGVLLDTGEELECALPPELAAVQRAVLAVGDRVDVSRVSGPPRVAGIRPRKTVLQRPDAARGGETQRIVAANIDAVVIVASVVRPPLQLRLVDRYLIAVERGGAAPVVCVNKIDLLEDAEAHERLASELAPYRALGLTVVPCSASRGDGIDRLRQALAGRLCVVVGKSGAGKSSLVNALEPRLEIVTRPLAPKTGKGRHTTTASRLYEVGEGTRIIDTPGIREFGLWRLTREELMAGFRDFDPYRGACRFADCTHTHEPDCAVLEAVESGDVPRARYDSYRRLEADL